MAKLLRGKSTVTGANIIGMIAPIGMATPTIGWLVCNGAAYNSSTLPQYAALFLAIGNTWGGSDATDFQVPDLDGAFLRGVGTSTVFTQDSAVTLAGVQSDQTQEHTHSLGFSMSGPHDVSHVGGVNWGGNSWNASTYSDLQSAWPSVGNAGMYLFGAGGTSRVGNETRPNNIGVQFCIRYAE